MKCVLAILALACAASALSDSLRWSMFKATFGKTYPNASVEQRRYQTFVSNIRRAAALDAIEPFAFFGVTQFSDLTPSEFLQKYAGFKVPTNASRIPVFTDGRVGNAQTTDWVARGLVTPVKDQGYDCNADWAFAAAGAAEGCFASVFNDVLSLSTQEYIDCDWTQSYGGGCMGGTSIEAVDWAVSESLTTDKKYPYVGSQHDYCLQTTLPSVLDAGSCKAHRVYADNNEAALSDALTHSTVAVAIDASALQFYQAGPIMMNCDYDGLNHQLLLVSDAGDDDTYVLKDSYGVNYGESGYIRLAKGVNCLGIANNYASLAYAA